jgi:hypothetical protein
MKATAMSDFFFTGIPTNDILPSNFLWKTSLDSKRQKLNLLRLDALPKSYF